MSKPLNVVYPRDDNVSQLIVTISHNPCNLVVPKSNNTRVQSGQPVMTREEDDGIYVALDPQ
ncbi:hypothetical protein Tco_1277742, partial [Tanacetum coccineum]